MRLPKPAMFDSPFTSTPMIVLRPISGVVTSYPTSPQRITTFSPYSTATPRIRGEPENVAHVEIQMDQRHQAAGPHDAERQRQQCQRGLAQPAQHRKCEGADEQD